MHSANLRSTIGRLTVIAAATLVAACTPSGPTPPPASSPRPSAASAPSAPAASPAAPSAAAASPAAPSPSVQAAVRNPAAYVEGEAFAPAFDPAAFVDGIDNPFFPMVIGARFVFNGDERVVVEVLDRTKPILGIQATVVRDRVFADGQLVEDTLDWYGQDRDGNVWYLGEQTAEYEGGKVTSTAGSWEAGVDGALPGVIMLADPQAGDVYRQEFLAGEAEDLGQITALDGAVSVPAGSWSGDDVLVTEEWTPLEPGVRERKTYVRGLGVVEVVTIEGGHERTTLRRATIPH